MTNSNPGKLAEKKSASSPSGFLRWSICVLISAVPFAVFLLCLNLFASSAIPQDGILDVNGWESGIISAEANETGAVYQFHLAVMNFIHILVCACAGVYFLARFVGRSIPIGKMLFCAIYALVMFAALTLQLKTHTTFYAYMFEPVLNAMNTVNIARPNLLASTNSQFLKTALLWPTTLGVIIVILASGSFHARLFSQDEGSGSVLTVAQHLSELKHDLIVLSIAFVSSAITAHLFFNLPEAVFAPSSVDAANTAAAYYNKLASALSFGAGLLFSATLLAAFAPGYFTLMSSPKDGSVKQAGLAQDPQNLFENLKAATEGLRSVWKSIAALLAPVLASPIFELFNQLVSGA